MDTYKVERIGKARDEFSRPVRLRLNGEVKRDLMSRKKLLKEIDEFKDSVWINDDETQIQRYEKYKPEGSSPANSLGTVAELCPVQLATVTIAGLRTVQPTNNSIMQYSQVSKISLTVGSI